MTERNKHLNYLIVREYVRILFGLYSRKVITAEQAINELGRYMHKTGFSGPVVGLAVCVYLALL